MGNENFIDFFNRAFLSFDTSAISNMFSENPEAQEELIILIKKVSSTPIITTSQVKQEFSSFDHSSCNIQLDKTIKSFLFENVTIPWGEDTRNKYVQNGEKRYSTRTPPGYKDRNKEGLQKFGDYFIWQQLMDYAKEHNIDILFVTNDQKADWYNKSTRNYRQELYDEFRKATTKTISFMNLKDFYSNCQSMFNIKLDTLLEELERGEVIKSSLQKCLWCKCFHCSELQEYFETNRHHIESIVDIIYDYIDDIEIAEIDSSVNYHKEKSISDPLTYEGVSNCEVTLNLMGYSNGECVRLASINAIITINTTFSCEIKDNTADISDMNIDQIELTYLLSKDKEFVHTETNRDLKRGLFDGQSIFELKKIDNT